MGGCCGRSKNEGISKPKRVCTAAGCGWALNQTYKYDMTTKKNVLTMLCSNPHCRRTYAS